jgi:hypothetical protein
MKSIVIRGKRINYYLTWALIGLVAAAVTFYTQGCAGPPLKPWHTEKLTEEFTVELADEIRFYNSACNHQDLGNG